MTFYIPEIAVGFALGVVASLAIIVALVWIGLRGRRRV